MATDANRNVGDVNLFKQKESKIMTRYFYKETGMYIDWAQLESLPEIDTFIDGGAVSKIGDTTFDIIKNNVDDVFTTLNEEIANIMIEFYEYEGIILEPAGALGIAGLSNITFNPSDNVVCILSGGNNDITRYQEIMDLNLRYLNRKHYFIIQFIQKPGQLTSFMNILGKGDDHSRHQKINSTYQKHVF